LQQTELSVSICSGEHDVNTPPRFFPVVPSHTALAFDVSALRLATANDRTLFIEKECKFHALLKKGTIILGVARVFESHRAQMS